MSKATDNLNNLIKAKFESKKRVGNKWVYKYRKEISGNTLSPRAKDIKNSYMNNPSVKSLMSRNRWGLMNEISKHKDEYEKQGKKDHVAAMDSILNDIKNYQKDVDKRIEKQTK